MNDTDLKRHHVALEQAGTVRGAAALLEVEPQALRKVIAAHPELRSYLPKAEPPLEVEAMSRPALALTQEELATVEVVEATDRQAQAGLEAMGVVGEAREEAMAFVDFGRNHFESMRHMMGGGIGKLFCDLMADIKKVRGDIDRTAIDPTLLDTSKALREDRSRLIKLALDAAHFARESAHTAAIIEAKKNEAKQARRNPKAQPGFAPLAMQVHGDVKVMQSVPTSSQP